MVCKSFLRFKKEDHQEIFKSACCLFIHQKMEFLMDRDVGPQRDKMLMDLNRFAKTASDMISKQSFDVDFDNVINIKDKYGVNSFIERRQRENPDINYSILNSIFIDHMFARNDNPTDSSISDKYVKRIHEAASILRKMSQSIYKEKKGIPRPIKAIPLSFESVEERMINLIDLINGEKFDFEDVEAWRMGAIMENRYKEHWKIRSDELAQLRNRISERIQAGEIQSIAGVDIIIEEKRNQIMHEEEIAIKAINDTELEPYFKHRLIQQLRDQVETVSRNYRTNLRNDLANHECKIAKEEGQLSDRELQRKIIERIKNMTVVANLSEDELDARFSQFWINDVLNIPEIRNLQQNIVSAKRDQEINYEIYVNDGVNFALQSYRYGISVYRAFKNMDEVYSWNFSSDDFKSIQVMADKDNFYDEKSQDETDKSYSPSMGSNTKFKYAHFFGDKYYISEFHDRFCDENGKTYKNYQCFSIDTLEENSARNTSTKFDAIKQAFQNGVNTTVRAIETGVSKITTNLTGLFQADLNEFNATKYGNFMSELHSKFEKSINDNPHTQRNFDGTADEREILNLCMNFKTALDEQAAKYKITEYMKPRFSVICVVFGAYKMLLPRLLENSEQSSIKNDHIKQLNMKREHYKNLFRLKLKGAQNSELWQQQIVHSLKESIVQMYLQKDGARATHYEVNKMIRHFSASQDNLFPSLETYRRFRFSMYMDIMNESRLGSNKAAVFQKWKKICRYDMEPCEKEYIRLVFNISKSSVLDFFHSKTQILFLI